MLEKKTISPGLFKGLLKALSIFIIYFLFEALFKDDLQLIVKDFLNEYSSNEILLEQVIPATISLISPVILVILLFYLCRNYISYLVYNDIRAENENSNPKKENTNDQLKENNDSQELIESIGKVGIVNITYDLKASEYNPIQCMNLIEKRMYFLGILGSKWVNEKNHFDKFITRIQSKNGEVKFLLINPSTEAYNDLRGFRQQAITAESLREFYSFQKKYKCLKIKLYDHLPSFRMIFIDEKILAVSTYKKNKNEYFKSNFGWANPHLIINSKADWSFYAPFEDLFYQIWNKSIGLERYMEDWDNNIGMELYRENQKHKYKIQEQ